MTRKLLVILAMCAFTIAMVPKDRRDVNTEEHKETPKAGTVVCERQTPCAWSVYKTHQDTIEYNITNTYCSCGPGTVCTKDEDDKTASSYVYRCRDPAEKKDDSDK